MKRLNGVSGGVMSSMAGSGCEKVGRDPAARGRRGVRWGLFVGLLLTGVAALAGCSHVVAYTTPYYKDGPAQIAGPQGDLQEGTRVLVVGRDGSYTRVWTAGGIDAYVLESSVVSVWEWQRRKAAQEQPKKNEKEPLVILPDR